MDLDVVVAGGGLAGASLAVALQRTGLRIAVVEARAPARSAEWDNRIYAISPSSQQFLDRLGVWARLDGARLTPITEMAVFGDGSGRLRFSAYESGLTELAWTAESSLIHLELWETLKRQHNVTLMCPARISAVEFQPSAAVLTLDDGRRLRTRLLVAADGVDSQIRTQAGIAADFVSYDELGVVANFRCEKPHRGVAHQWFGEHGVLAYLPLPDNHISIVWSAPEAFGRELLTCEPAALCRAVAEAGGNTLGELTLASEPVGFPLRLMRVAHTVRPRVALIGDAAHAIHPLSGHGINLGFQDANVLAQALEALPAWRDPGELGVLRAYARARAEEPALMQFATHALNRLFHARNPVLALLRNSGMNLTARLPVVKSALVRYAASGRF